MEKDINKIIIDEDTYNFRDNSIPAWAKEPSKPSYSASDVGALPIGTNIPVIQYIDNESLMPASPIEGVLYLIGEEEKVMITFIINSTPYTAIEGMTWGEWVESEYNTGNYIISGDLYISVYGDYTNSYVVHPTSGYVEVSDIISEVNYYRDTGGSND